MTVDRLLKARRRVVLVFGGSSIGVFAAYLAAFVLAGERFGLPIFGVPLGLWVALAAVSASFLLVVAFALVSTRRIDPAIRAIGERA